MTIRDGDGLVRFTIIDTSRETAAEKRSRLARAARFIHAAKQAWTEDHPGHTDADYDLWGSCSATDEQARHWQEWSIKFAARWRIENSSANHERSS